MDYHELYEMILDLQEELEAQHHDAEVGCLDYKVIKALSATYELQVYLANRIAMVGDLENDPYDEIIAQACREYEEARSAALPDPADCRHEFSPEFQAAMQQLIEENKGK